MTLPEKIKIYDYFLEHFGIVIVWNEEYETIATDHPEEYQQYLESQKEEE